MLASTAPQTLTAGLQNWPIQQVIQRLAFPLSQSCVGGSQYREGPPGTTKGRDCGVCQRMALTCSIEVSFKGLGCRFLSQNHMAGLSVIEAALPYSPLPAPPHPILCSELAAKPRRSAWKNITIMASKVPARNATLQPSNKLPDQAYETPLTHASLLSKNRRC